MRKILPILMILALLAPQARAEKVFGQANDYLQYGAGARALGMGGAFTGLADDASAEYWNPAAIAFVDEYQLMTMYAPFAFDSNLYYASLALPMGPLGALSASDILLHEGDFQGRSDLNQVTASGESIMKHSVGLSYAHTIKNIFSAGVKIKFLQEKVFSKSGDAFGWDLALYSKPFAGVSGGLAINNVNRPRITLAEDPNIYGRNYKLGLAYHARKDKLLVTVDANKLEDQNIYYTYGLEISPIKLLSLRGGFNQQNDLTLGFGVKMRYLTLDYAFSNRTDFGSFNKVSLTYRWGNVYEAKARPMGQNNSTKAIYLEGLHNEIKFDTSIPHYGIKNWSLTITDADGKLVRDLKGESRPPDKIIWDAFDNAGQPVKRGDYSYKFRVEYKGDREWEEKGEFTLNYRSSMPTDVDIKVKGDQSQEAQPSSTDGTPPEETTPNAPAYEQPPQTPAAPAPAAPATGSEAPATPAPGPAPATNQPAPPTKP